MGTIRNKMVIVHDYDFKRIEKIREDAIKTFQQAVCRDYADSSYDINTSMVSPILESYINQEYSFVIMGDCSKLGWSTAKIFDEVRKEWISKWDSIAYKILLVDFGEGDYESSIKDYGY